LKSLLDEGFRVGELIRKQVQDACAKVRSPDEFWMSRGKRLSYKHAPLAMAFMVGIADGAGVEFDRLFACWYEELRDITEKQKKDRGCTDIIVRSGDAVLIAHTNDESPGDGLAVADVVAPNMPVVTFFFSGGRPSAAVNGAGIVFSGNQVDSKDVRPGIPRVVLYVEACWSHTIKDAVRILLNPERASSFNHVLADASGKVIGIEASATKAVAMGPSDGLMVHTNHFLGIPEQEARSGKSLDQSTQRLARSVSEIRKRNDVGVNDLIRIMSTHGDGGLCRHGETETVFSVVFAPRQRSLWYSPGRPCRASRYQTITY